MSLSRVLHRSVLPHHLHTRITNIAKLHNPSFPPATIVPRSHHRRTSTHPAFPATHTHTQPLLTSTYHTLSSPITSPITTLEKTPLHSRALSTKRTPAPLAERVAQLCKERGFVSPSCEVYGGLAGSYDYGPRGVELKRAVSDAWWARFVRARGEVVGVDTPVVLRRQVWQAAGHEESFQDPLVECRVCQRRSRADHLFEACVAAMEGGEGVEGGGDGVGGGKDGVRQLVDEVVEDKQDMGKLSAALEALGATCEHCGAADLAPAKQFNLLFETAAGQHRTYLRPETAQGIFVAARFVQRSSGLKLPFGVAQAGRAFRNEISPGNFLFRSREFEQLELEYFCREEQAGEHFEQLLDECLQFLTHECGIPRDMLRLVPHGPGDLAHYALAATDIEFKYPHGWGELWGVANRGRYDLEQHAKASGKQVFEPFVLPDGTVDDTLPHVIEPSVGLDRLLYAILVSAYDEVPSPKGAPRKVLRIAPRIAPFEYAVFPLAAKAPAHMAQAEELARRLRLAGKRVAPPMVKGSIGKRYLMEDKSGTPYCVTVDDRTSEDNTVTVRLRDTGEQVRAHVDEVVQGQHPVA